MDVAVRSPNYHRQQAIKRWNQAVGTSDIIAAASLRVEAVEMLNGKGMLNQPAELLQLVSMATAAGQKQTKPLTALTMFAVAQAALATLASQHPTAGCGRGPFKLALARCVPEAYASKWKEAMASARLAATLLQECAECNDDDGLNLSRIATDLGVAATELAYVIH